MSNTLELYGVNLKKRTGQTYKSHCGRLTQPKNSNTTDTEW